MRKTIKLWREIKEAFFYFFREGAEWEMLRLVGPKRTYLAVDPPSSWVLWCKTKRGTIIILDEGKF